MQTPADQSATFTGNQAYGNSTNHYGHNYTNAHYHGGLNCDRCLHDLRVTDPREDRARIEHDKDRLLQQCYRWILDDVNFQRWKNKREAHLLWIKGDPGKGKTMMTMGLINELGHDPQTELLSYFFCQSTMPELSSAVSVLRGLIYLIVIKKRELIRHIQERYDAAGSKLFEGPNAIYALREILSDILNDSALPKTYLVVDALDECTSGLSELLRIITDNRLSQPSKIKWLVTSRNMPNIERYLHPSSLSDKVSLELNASHISKAVTAFVDFKVQHLVDVKGYNPIVQAKVRQVLQGKAEDTFLWVSLVCKELEVVPLYRTEEVLHELPPGLDPLYSRMRAQISAQNDSRTTAYCEEILRSITLAYRPLRLEEIAIAAGLPTDKFGSVETADLIRRCGSFLTVRQDIVSLIHLSAKDYFMSDKGNQFLDSVLAQENGRLSHRLLNAISGKLCRDMCKLRKPGALITEATAHIQESILPQIAYACEYWIYHLCDYTQHHNALFLDDSKILYFLQKHALHWLEAMSLLQKVPHAIAAIRKLQSAFAGSKSTEFYLSINDVLRFIMWSGAVVQEAPLQVYYSALLFAPRRSITRRLFEKETRHWIRIKSEIDEDWGPLLQTLKGHTGGVTSVAFSPQGDRLASASWDRTIRLWDAETGQMLQTLQGHTSRVTSVVFSPQGDRLASASWDRTIRLWDIDTGQMLQTLQGHTGDVTSVAFSPQGDRLASASYDSTVRLWDAETGQLLQTLQGHASGVTSVVFSPQGDRLASASWDYTIRLWDVDTGQMLQTLQSHTSGVTSVAFSPQGDQLASASYDSTVRLWDAETGQLLQTLQGHASGVTSVVFSPQGDRLASASWDATIRLWDAETGQLLQTLQSHTSRFTSVVFSPQGDRLASASWDHTIPLWDAETGQLLQTLQGHTSRVTSVAFSPQGDRLASASYDSTVRLWDAETGQLLQVLDQDHIPEWEASDTHQILSAQGQWVFHGLDGVLLLPIQHEVSCSASYGSIIALGTMSGRIFILSFNEEAARAST